jgi:hypothetical protein
LETQVLLWGQTIRGSNKKLKSNTKKKVKPNWKTGHTPSNTAERQKEARDRESINKSIVKHREKL